MLILDLKSNNKDINTQFTNFQISFLSVSAKKKFLEN